MNGAIGQVWYFTHLFLVWETILKDVESSKKQAEARTVDFFPPNPAHKLKVTLLSHDIQLVLRACVKSEGRAKFNNNGSSEL